MNRPVRATDAVNFVMKNGDIRPLLVVRSWDLTPPPAPAAAPAVPHRAGEQVKFPAHNQPGQFVIAHVSGLLLIDPSVDADNVPVQAPVLPAPPLPNKAELEAAVATGNAVGATPEQVQAGKDAAATLAKPTPAPTPVPPVAGLPFGAWIAVAAYDQGKAPGTWHWPLGS
jgi:hypothetical protein